MKNLLLAITLFTFSFVNSQVLEPVTWSTSVEKVSDTEYKLIATASIDGGWHLYSQTVPEGGPIPTSFTFAGNSNYLKKGNTSEEKGHTIMDPIFEMEITYFDTKATFEQIIRVKGDVPFKVEGTVEFMVCDDSRCLPPTEVDLIYNVK